MNRRLFLGGVATLAASLRLPQPARATQAMGFEEARHLLSRTSLGVMPAEVQALAKMDYAGAVDRLLGSAHPQAATPLPDWAELSPVEVQRLEKAAKARRVPDAQGNLPKIVRPLVHQATELRYWWLEEMLSTDQQLVERMVMVWHGHFTSSHRKVKYPPALLRQNALFRREALGNFATLLREIARDPAMLIYLDVTRSVARRPNENFARELLELFTLGEGHYGEADVKEAARAFTGRTVDRNTGRFVERPAKHDDGEKTFLDKTGRFDGDEIVAVLLAHPRTAETVVERLWREFVSLAPDPAEVKRLSAVFRDGRYEIRPLLRAMFLSDSFRDPANRGALIKSPVDLVVGTARVLGPPLFEKAALVRMLQGLGQLPFDPPNVKGWPGGELWITNYTLLQRQQILRRMVDATAVAPMAAPGMSRTKSPGPDDDGTMQLMEPRSAGAGNDLEARLGPALAGADGAVLLRTLLPLPPIDAVDAKGSAGAVVAAALLDTAYQLK